MPSNDEVVRLRQIDRELTTGTMVQVGVGAYHTSSEYLSQVGTALLAVGATTAIGNAYIASRITPAAATAGAAADNVADYARLTRQLQFDGASSVFTKSGGLAVTSPLGRTVLFGRRR